MNTLMLLMGCEGPFKINYQLTNNKASRDLKTKRKSETSKSQIGGQRHLAAPYPIIGIHVNK